MTTPDRQLVAGAAITSPPTLPVAHQSFDQAPSSNGFPRLSPSVTHKALETTFGFTETAPLRQANNHGFHRSSSLLRQDGQSGTTPVHGAPQSVSGEQVNTFFHPPVAGGKNARTHQYGRLPERNGPGNGDAVAPRVGAVSNGATGWPTAGENSSWQGGIPRAMVSLAPFTQNRLARSEIHQTTPSQLKVFANPPASDLQRMAVPEHSLLSGASALPRQSQVVSSCGTSPYSGLTATSLLETRSQLSSANGTSKSDADTSEADNSTEGGSSARLSQSMESIDIPPWQGSQQLLAMNTLKLKHIADSRRHSNPAADKNRPPVQSSENRISKNNDDTSSVGHRTKEVADLSESEDPPAGRGSTSSSPGSSSPAFRHRSALPRGMLAPTFTNPSALQASPYSQGSVVDTGLPCSAAQDNELAEARNRALDVLAESLGRDSNRLLASTSLGEGLDVSAQQDGVNIHQSCASMLASSSGRPVRELLPTLADNDTLRSSLTAGGLETAVSSPSTTSSGSVFGRRERQPVMSPCAAAAFGESTVPGQSVSSRIGQQEESNSSSQTSPYAQAVSQRVMAMIQNMFPASGTDFNALQPLMENMLATQQQQTMEALQMSPDVGNSLFEAVQPFVENMLDASQPHVMQWMQHLASSPTPIDGNRLEEEQGEDSVSRQMAGTFQSLMQSMIPAVAQAMANPQTDDSQPGGQAALGEILAHMQVGIDGSEEAREVMRRTERLSSDFMAQLMDQMMQSSSTPSSPGMARRTDADSRSNVSEESSGWAASDRQTPRTSPSAGTSQQTHTQAHQNNVSEDLHSSSTAHPQPIQTPPLADTSLEAENGSSGETRSMATSGEQATQTIPQQEVGEGNLPVMESHLSSTQLEAAAENTAQLAADMNNDPQLAADANNVCQLAAAMNVALHVTADANNTSPTPTASGGGGPSDELPVERAPHFDPRLIEMEREECAQYLAGHRQNENNSAFSHSLPVRADSDSLFSNEDDDNFYADPSLSPSISLEMPTQLKCVPFRDDDRRRKSACPGKVMLHTSILVVCTEEDLPPPYTFTLTNPSSGVCYHVGVLEFTALEEDEIVMPESVLRQLGLSYGDMVNFQHTILPPGKFVQLQPISSAFIAIPYQERMTLLQSELANFMTLTQGSTISISYGINVYMLKVLQCQPDRGILIVDQDLTTDIVEPLDMDPYYVADVGECQPVEFDRPLSRELSAGDYHFFALVSRDGKPLPSQLKVEVIATKGDPDLFLCQSKMIPTAQRYTWCAQNFGSVEINLGPHLKDWIPDQPQLYAGVGALCDDASYSICFRRNDTVAAEAARALEPVSQSIANQTTPETTAEELSRALGPGEGRCAMCHKIVKEHLLAYHERHCKKKFYRCEECNVLVADELRKKHPVINHRLLDCECGAKLPQLALHEHQRVDCIKRLTACSFWWCNLKVPLDNLERHEERCGLTPHVCHICKRDIEVRHLENHFIHAHLINTDNIDWTKPLPPQTTKKLEMLPSPVARLPFPPRAGDAGPSIFDHASSGDSSPDEMPANQGLLRCSCGKRFTYEDDLFVHMLTDCPQTAQHRQEEHRQEEHRQPQDSATRPEQVESVLDSNLQNDEDADRLPSASSAPVPVPSADFRHRCLCGKSFEYEDELQVHMLTDCEVHQQHHDEPADGTCSTPMMQQTTEVPTAAGDRQAQPSQQPALQVNPQAELKQSQLPPFQPVAGLGQLFEQNQHPQLPNLANAQVSSEPAAARSSSARHVQASGMPSSMGGRPPNLLSGQPPHMQSQAPIIRPILESGQSSEQHQYHSSEDSLPQVDPALIAARFPALAHVQAAGVPNSHADRPPNVLFGQPPHMESQAPFTRPFLQSGQLPEQHQNPPSEESLPQVNPALIAARFPALAHVQGAGAPVSNSDRTPNVLFGQPPGIQSQAPLNLPGLDQSRLSEQQQQQRLLAEDSLPQVDPALIAARYPSFGRGVRFPNSSVGQVPNVLLGQSPVIRLGQPGMPIPPSQQLLGAANLTGMANGSQVQQQLTPEQMQAIQMHAHQVSAQHQVHSPISMADIERHLNGLPPHHLHGLHRLFANRTESLQCPCGERFTEQDDFEVHQLTTCPHREALVEALGQGRDESDNKTSESPPESRSPPPQPEVEEERYRCPHCEETFKYEDDMQVHQLTTHASEC